MPETRELIMTCVLWPLCVLPVYCHLVRFAIPLYWCSLVFTHILSVTQSFGAFFYKVRDCLTFHFLRFYFIWLYHFIANQSLNYSLYQWLLYFTVCLLKINYLLIITKWMLYWKHCYFGVVLNECQKQLKPNALLVKRFLHSL